jgi:hypothetical protein
MNPRDDDKILLKENDNYIEIAELGFEPTASKSQEITGVGTTSDHWGRGWKPTGDERPCFFWRHFSLVCR